MRARTNESGVAREDSGRREGRRAAFGALTLISLLPTMSSNAFCMAVIAFPISTETPRAGATPPQL